MLPTQMHGRGRGRGGRGGGPFPRGGGEEDGRGRDKAMRSIFGEWVVIEGVLMCVWLMFFSHPVANVGFDTTEEQLGKVLCEVGPIVNLK